MDRIIKIADKLTDIAGVIVAFVVAVLCYLLLLRHTLLRVNIGYQIGFWIVWILAVILVRLAWRKFRKQSGKKITKNESGTQR